jgi:hypothetical protein
MLNMLTVPQVIEKVYGKATKAADELGVQPSAVSNWKAAGQFPARLAASILIHARERDIDLDIEQIPFSTQVKGDA